MISRRLPLEGEYEGFSEVKNFIMQGDFRYGNLETTVHNFESYGGAQSGGSWLCSPPGVIDDLRKFGMNVLCTANNHALDYSYGGLIKTLEYLEKADMPYAGTGRSLADASRPVYIDTVSGRYALIGCTAAFTLVAAIAVVVLCCKVGSLEEEVRALRKSKNLPAMYNPDISIVPVVSAEPIAQPVPVYDPNVTVGEVSVFDVDDRTAAKLMAIVADEMKTPLSQLRFISIKEVK